MQSKTTGPQATGRQAKALHTKASQAKGRQANECLTTEPQATGRQATRRQANALQPEAPQPTAPQPAVHQTRQPATYGYARVSTADQNLSRQLDAFSAFGIPPDLVYSDKASGKDFERPEWRRLVRRLREGEVLVVTSIDRLGRTYDEIIDQWQLITRKRGAHIVVLDMPLLDTREKPNDITGAFIAGLVLQLLSYVAQVERESIRNRQAEGIAAAKARGVHFGRPACKRPSTYEATKASFDVGSITRKEAAARLGVSTTTFDKWRAQDAGGGASA